LTAEYTCNRKQFERPIGSFQGVALRAADAYIDVEAMRSIYWEAIWRLTEGLPATAEIAAAKWWACTAGHRVVHTAQHLHGGIGADVEYPIHRYFLSAKQVGLLLAEPTNSWRGSAQRCRQFRLSQMPRRGAHLRAQMHKDRARRKSLSSLTTEVQT